ncbi:MAG: MFS transporter, partial [Candidatus Bathyarchaeia archaeon]
MRQRSGSGWYLSFIPYNIAEGILSTLIPLYLVDELQGSLSELGVITFAATVLAIPASVFLGRLPDRYGRSKPFIAISFLGVSIFLFLMPFTKSVKEFGLLYIAMSIVKYINEPSTSVLIAESFERSQWGKALAKQSFIEGAAQATGLAICSLGVKHFGYVMLLRSTGPLVFASFISTMFTVQDPPLYIERLLSRFEQPIEDVETLSFSFQSRGALTPSRRVMKFGQYSKMGFFGVGTIFFAFAASNAFVPLPVYLRESLPASAVFTVYLAR